MLRVYIVLSFFNQSTGFFANAFTRRHPSETLNENAKHDHSMYLERSSILHSSFLPQISKSLKPTKPTHARIHAHLSQTREDVLRMLTSRVINTNCIPCALKRKVSSNGLGTKKSPQHCLSSVVHFNNEARSSRSGLRDYQRL